MDNIPFFSVVIPTRNRPLFLKDAILSVLKQNFSDYEILVSDNNNEAPTINIINQFSQYTQFRSIRTFKELNMIDHWEFATKQAKGKYILLLADRKVLYQGALKKLHKILTKHSDINVFSFGVQSFDENIGKMRCSATIGKTTIFSGIELINNFLNTNYFTYESWDRKYPKTLNGVFKNEYSKEIRNKYGRYFNLYGVTTPDYSSFFINCFLNDRLMYIGEKIILTQGESISNGRLFGNGNYHQYMKSLNLNNPFEKVPIKAPLIFNLLLSDFINVSISTGNSNILDEINWENYFITCYYEILLKLQQGIDDKFTNYFISSWHDGLVLKKMQSKRETLIKRAHDQFNMFNKNNKIDVLINFNAHLKDYLSVRYGYNHLLNKIIKFKYNSIFEAAGFNN